MELISTYFQRVRGAPAFALLLLFVPSAGSRRMFALAVILSRPSAKTTQYAADDVVTVTSSSTTNDRTLVIGVNCECVCVCE